MKTLIILVRHGKHLNYTADMPKYPGPGLSKLGKLQAKKTAKYLKAFKFDRIYSSDMRRAMETVAEINKYQKKKITYHREIAEHNRIIFKKNPSDKDKFKTNLRRAEGALKFFRRLLKQNKGKKVLIVAHGNVIRCIIGTSSGFKIRNTTDLGTPNCSITALLFEDGELVRLCCVNSTDHLGYKFNKKMDMHVADIW